MHKNLQTEGKVFQWKEHLSTGHQIFRFLGVFDLLVSVFFSSAFLRDFFLWLDRLSGDGASNTWRSPAV